MVACVKSWSFVPLFAMALLASCAKPSATAPAVADDSGQTSVEVVAADANAETMTLRGANLPNPGPDGNQTVEVSPGDAAIGYVGHTIKGDFDQGRNNSWRLDNIWPDNPGDPAIIKGVMSLMNSDSVAKGHSAFRDRGDQLPAFALYNQDGKLVQYSSLRGRRLVINFIYTNCPDPTMCPASTRRMAELQKALKDAKVDDVTLVTITVDPTHDTPGVLRQYAKSNNLDLGNFQLLTGPPEEVLELERQLGVEVKIEDGVLQHMMATLIVNAEGRITYRYPGSDWREDDFLQRLLAK
jgi:protein SCO1